MHAPLTIALEEHPKTEDIEAVRAGLASYNKSYAPEDHHAPLTICLRDADDQVVGGLLGGSY
jgi:hypothetical protein